MNSIQATKFAIKYLCGRVKKEEDYDLHPALRYVLHRSVDRLTDAWSEDNITAKDVSMLVESWIIAQGTSAIAAQPLCRINKSGA